jgi:hypothetical protein
VRVRALPPTVAAFVVVATFATATHAQSPPTVVFELFYSRSEYNAATNTFGAPFASPIDGAWVEIRNIRGDLIAQGESVGGRFVLESPRTRQEVLVYIHAKSSAARVGISKTALGTSLLPLIKAYQSPPFGPIVLGPEQSQSVFRVAMPSTLPYEDNSGSPELEQAHAYNGSFFIFDTLHRAHRRVEAELRENLEHRPTAIWARRRCQSDECLGAAYDSDRNVIILMGDADKNTDEFDTPVILHEYGHFLQDVLVPRNEKCFPPSRGKHILCEITSGDFAWHEGWANWISAVLRGSPVYYDTQRKGGQPDAFVFDLSAPDDPDRTNGRWRCNDEVIRISGPSNEGAVASLLWQFLGGRLPGTALTSISFRDMLNLMRSGDFAAGSSQFESEECTIERFCELTDAPWTANRAQELGIAACARASTIVQCGDCQEYDNATLSCAPLPDMTPCEIDGGWPCHVGRCDANRQVCVPHSICGEGLSCAPSGCVQDLTCARVRVSAPSDGEPSASVAPAVAWAPSLCGNLEAPSYRVQIGRSANFHPACDGTSLADQQVCSQNVAVNEVISAPQHSYRVPAGRFGYDTDYVVRVRARRADGPSSIVAGPWSELHHFHTMAQPQCVECQTFTAGACVPVANGTACANDGNEWYPFSEPRR